MNNVLFAEYLKLRDLQTRFEQITGDCNSEQLPETKPPWDYKKEAIAALIDNKEAVVGAAALGAYGLYKSTQSTQSSLTNTEIEIALQAEITELEKKLDDCHKSQYESYFSKFEREVASTQEKIKFAISHLVEQKNENKGLRQQVQALEANQQSLEKQNKDLAVALEQEKNEQIALRKSGCENLREIATSLANTPCNEAAITVPDLCNPKEISATIKSAIIKLADCMKIEKEEVEKRQEQQEARQLIQNTKDVEQKKKDQEQAAKEQEQKERQIRLDKKEKEQTDLLKTVQDFAKVRCNREVSGDIKDLLNSIVQCTECNILEELKVENNICKVAFDALSDNKNCRESIKNAFTALIACSTKDNNSREEEKKKLCVQLEQIAEAIRSLCPTIKTTHIPECKKPSEYATIILTDIKEITECLSKKDEDVKAENERLCTHLKTINTKINELCPIDLAVNVDCRNDKIGDTIANRIKACFETEKKNKNKELNQQKKEDQKTTCNQLQRIIAALNTNKCLPATKIDDITPETCEPVTVTTNIIARITDIFNCFEKEKTQKDTDIQQQKKATCSHLQKIITALNENECLPATKLKDIESEICDPGIVTPIITAAIGEILTCYQNEKANKDLEIRNQKNDLTEKLNQWCKNIEFIVTKLKEIPCLDADSQTKLSELAIGCDEKTIDKIKAAIDILVECIKKEKDDAIKTEKQNADTMLSKVQKYVKDHCDETGSITDRDIDILLGKLDNCTECNILTKIKENLKDRLAECPLAVTALDNKDCKKAIVDAVGSLMTCFKTGQARVSELIGEKSTLEREKKERDDEFNRICITLGKIATTINNLCTTTANNIDSNCDKPSSLAKRIEGEILPKINACFDQKMEEKFKKRNEEFCTAMKGIVTKLKDIPCATNTELQGKLIILSTAECNVKTYAEISAAITLLANCITDEKTKKDAAIQIEKKRTDDLLTAVNNFVKNCPGYTKSEDITVLLNMLVKCTECTILTEIQTALKSELAQTIQQCPAVAELATAGPTSVDCKQKIVDVFKALVTCLAAAPGIECERIKNKIIFDQINKLEEIQFQDFKNDTLSSQGLNCEETIRIAITHLIEGANLKKLLDEMMGVQCKHDTEILKTMTSHKKIAIQLVSDIKGCVDDLNSQVSQLASDKTSLTEQKTKLEKDLAAMPTTICNEIRGIVRAAFDPIGDLKLKALTNDLLNNADCKEGIKTAIEQLAKNAVKMNSKECALLSDRVNKYCQEIGNLRKRIEKVASGCNSKVEINPNPQENTLPENCSANLIAIDQHITRLDNCFKSSAQITAPKQNATPQDKTKNINWPKAWDLIEVSWGKKGLPKLRGNEPQIYLFEEKEVKDVLDLATIFKDKYIELYKAVVKTIALCKNIDTDNVEKIIKNDVNDRQYNKMNSNQIAVKLLEDCSIPTPTSEQECKRLTEIAIAINNVCTGAIDKYCFNVTDYTKSIVDGISNLKKCLQEKDMALGQFTKITSKPALKFPQIGMFSPVEIFYLCCAGLYYANDDYINKALVQLADRKTIYKNGKTIYEIYLAVSKIYNDRFEAVRQTMGSIRDGKYIGDDGREKKGFFSADVSFKNVFNDIIKRQHEIIQKIESPFPQVDQLELSKSKIQDDYQKMRTELDNMVGTDVRYRMREDPFDSLYMFSCFKTGSP